MRTAPIVDYKIHWLKMMSVPESRAVVGRHDGISGRDNLLSQGKDFCVERRAVREDFDDLMHAGKGIR